MKKKTKKKIIKGSLYIITSFLFICITYLEAHLEKDEISLITYNNENKVYTSLTEKNVVNYLEQKTGVFLLTNNRKDITKYIDLLYKSNIKENIYVYNVKNDEIILELVNNEIKIKQEPSKLYEELIDHLGLYSETYLINNESEFIETKYKKIYTPVIMFIKDGRILYSHFIYGVDYSEEELIDIYKSGYEMLKEYKS